MPDRCEAEIVRAVGEATKCKTCVDVIGIEESKVPVCKAFADGIPAEIRVGNHKHPVNYPGNHGIKYIPLTVAR